MSLGRWMVQVGVIGQMLVDGTGGCHYADG